MSKKDQLRGKQQQEPRRDNRPATHRDTAPGKLDKDITSGKNKETQNVNNPATRHYQDKQQDESQHEAPDLL